MSNSNIPNELVADFSNLNDPCFQNLNHYSESINDIVCMWSNRGDVAICNLFTREHVFLPNPSMAKIITSSLLVPNSLRYWIFSIGVDKSWRKAYINIPNFFHKRKESVCIDGVIYFINFFGSRNIIAFSVRDEKAGYCGRQVHILNNLSVTSPKLEFHCASGDDDLGHNFPDGQNNNQVFDVFNDLHYCIHDGNGYVQEYTTECMWKVQADGFYLGYFNQDAGKVLYTKYRDW
ncbi:hypothetical protein H5410_061395 [Solanum commersonii]|uniref:F-box associated beta-propeller type 3 domain-containing protein n=1 Tax=Solanum commersonii TaxID=4109 RepID=A0A9J5W7P2_SOLCO|nr:hypothetical protein H5410_061395 [Solanum commersonii]